jgi:hypothetical protein
MIDIVDGEELLTIPDALKMVYDEYPQTDIARRDQIRRRIAYAIRFRGFGRWVEQPGKRSRPYIYRESLEALLYELGKDKLVKK